MNKLKLKGYYIPKQPEQQDIYCPDCEKSNIFEVVAIKGVLNLKCIKCGSLYDIQKIDKKIIATDISWNHFQEQTFQEAIKNE